jgi:type II secretory pathway component PulJ
VEGDEMESVYSFGLIQSKFTRLYEHEDLTPEISLSSEKKYQFEEGLDLSELDRGTLMELRGTIQLHPLYKFYQAIKYISSAAPDETTISEGDMQLIEDSLGDKIPIKIEVDGLSIAEGGAIREGSQGETFNVVSLLDETELWTEPIQTLASNKVFRIYCRVEAVEPDWYPMKLTRVLESISPPLAEKFSEELESELQTAMNQFEADINISSERIGIDHQMVESFSQFLCEKNGETIEDNQIDEIVEHVSERYSTEATVGFEQNVELLKQTHESFTEIVPDVEISQDEAALRSEFLQQSDQTEHEDSASELTTHLEANVIGVYW